jgi:ABC-type polysaccharide/polyol phosphate transport system ATPase subunit
VLASAAMTTAGTADERLAIQVRDLHEVFRLYKDRPPGLKERLYRFRRSRFEEFHALKGVSFDVHAGESLAIIGHNGSGKSTLLKCLARILPADQGSVQVNGRIATLLELGAGFHPDLSGRENIYLNGAILGMPKSELDEQFDAICDFAGVTEFIDQPVRNYSSGMYVRLGFAIAVHVQPDVLLVDEVLAVGDAFFQEKSLERMRRFNQRGKTVVLVSHDLTSIQALCERTLVLHHGVLVFDGPTEDAIEHYEELISSGRDPREDKPEPEPEAEDIPFRTGDERVRVREVRLESTDGRTITGPVTSGAQVRLVLDIEARDDVVADGGLTAGFSLRHPEMPLYVYETRTSWRGSYLAPPPKGEVATVAFDLDLNVVAGSYLVDTFVGSATTSAIHDRWQVATTIEVAGEVYDFGVAQLNARVGIHNPEGIWPPESLPPPVAQGGPRFHALRDEASDDRR